MRRGTAAVGAAGLRYDELLAPPPLRVLAELGVLAGLVLVLAVLGSAWWSLPLGLFAWGFSLAQRGALPTRVRVDEVALRTGRGEVPLAFVESAQVLADGRLRRHRRSREFERAASFASPALLACPPWAREGVLLQVSTVEGLAFPMLIGAGAAEHLAEALTAAPVLGARAASGAGGSGPPSLPLRVRTGLRPSTRSLLLPVLLLGVGLAGTFVGRGASPLVGVLFTGFAAIVLVTAACRRIEVDARVLRVGSRSAVPQRVRSARIVSWREAAVLAEGARIARPRLPVPVGPASSGHERCVALRLELPDELWLVPSADPLRVLAAVVAVQPEGLRAAREEARRPHRGEPDQGPP